MMDTMREERYWSRADSLIDWLGDGVRDLVVKHHGYRLLTMLCGPQLFGKDFSYYLPQTFKFILYITVKIYEKKYSSEIL